MTEARVAVVEVLNNLITVCTNGASGFTTAAEDAKNQELKQLFQGHARQRELYATELQAEVQRLGGQPAGGGTFAATLYRGWMYVKAALTGSSDASVLNECERGEGLAEQAYEEALSADLPAETATLLRRQLEQIKDSHARIRALQQVATAAVA